MRTLHHWMITGFGHDRIVVRAGWPLDTARPRRTTERWLRHEKDDTGTGGPVGRGRARAERLRRRRGGGDGGGGGQPSAAPTDLADTGNFTDPDRQGPVEIEGAQEGGIVKVISFTPLETMDPSEIYYTHTNAISTALLNRSLTQFVYDEETGQAVLVPDLATDLGTPNDDFTEWTFTIRDGVKYEDGSPVTAEDVKFGMERTLDVETFPESPGGYGLEYYEGAAEYDGPYTGKGAQLDSIAVDGNTITITMAKPFPDMPYWGAFPANGPIPADKADRPGRRTPSGRCRPVPTRSRTTRPRRR